MNNFVSESQVQSANGIILGLEGSSNEKPRFGFQRKDGWPLHLCLYNLKAEPASHREEEFVEEIAKGLGLKRSLINWRNNRWGWYRHLPHQPLLLIAGISENNTTEALAALQAQQDVVHIYVKKILLATDTGIFIDRIDPFKLSQPLQTWLDRIKSEFPGDSMLDRVNDLEIDKKFSEMFGSSEYLKITSAIQALRQNETVEDLFEHLRGPASENYILYALIREQLGELMPLFKSELDLPPAPARGKLAITGGQPNVL